MIETDHKTDSIDYDRSTYEHGPEPWKDPEVLQRLYWQEGLSMAEIGDHFDVVKGTIKYWLDRFEIDTREPMDERQKAISRSIDEDGKVQYHVPNGDGEMARFYRHQLVALLEYEPANVFDPENHIHHEMGAPVAVDIPNNLGVYDVQEHVEGHSEGWHERPPEVVLGRVFDEGIDLDDELLDQHLLYNLKQMTEAEFKAAVDQIRP